jgi:probable addiction module antidote protein
LPSYRALTREGLYKALKAGAQPRFDTVARVLAALGTELHIKAA